MTARRVLAGLAVAIVGVGSVFSAPLFALVLVAIAVIGSYEFAALARRTGASLALPVVIGGSVAYMALAFFEQMGRYESGLVALIAVAAIVFGFGGRIDHFGARIGWTLIATAYAGKLLSYFVVIRQEHNGLALVLWLIICVALTDIASMIVGVTFGQHRLWPQLSPGKTWEGAVAGLAAACIAGTLFGVSRYVGAPWSFALGFSAVISIAAQIGDLAESAFKREARVKDAGTLLADHGGVLDRFDSYVLSGAAAYAMLALAGRL